MVQSVRPKLHAHFGHNVIPGHIVRPDIDPDHRVFTGYQGNVVVKVLDRLGDLDSFHREVGPPDHLDLQGIVVAVVIPICFTLHGNPPRSRLTGGSIHDDLIIRARLVEVGTGAFRNGIQAIWQDTNDGARFAEKFA